MSQLDLALAADVSARHVSFLESGRSNPSEEMVLRLMGALEVPLREINHVLRAASYPARYPEPDLTTMDPAIDKAIERMLLQQEPYPMTVLNATYDIVRSNRATAVIFSRLLDEPQILSGTINLFDFVFDPALGRGAVKNWDEMGHYMISRLHREALRHPENSRLWTLLDRALSYPDVPQAWRQPDFSKPNAATLSISLERGAFSFRFFTAITTFSAPQQVTLDELRIESYFPLDEHTRAQCAQLWALSLNT
jgi:transcriptional regulator with XRE-family HTH domain